MKRPFFILFLFSACAMMYAQDASQCILPFPVRLSIFSMKSI